MKTYKIAAIPGHGIGAEVIAAGIEVLEMLAKQEGGFELRFEHFDWGSAYYLKHGEMMPADGLARDYPDLGGKATTAQVTRALGKVIETLPIHA
jgi:isocitrate/isopropylmalate dehydrogenase